MLTILRQPPGLPRLALLALPLALLAAAAAGCKGKPQTGSSPTASASPSSAAPASASLRPLAPPPPKMLTATQRVAAGKALYGKYCALCHGADARGYAADNAPSLVSNTFLMAATDAFIAQTIRVGRPGTPMGIYGQVKGGPLSEDEIGQIVSYLRSQGPDAVELPQIWVPGDAAAGKQVYEQHCQRCHGTREQRGDAPHLAGPELLDAASDAFLRFTIQQGRDGTKMEPYANKLSEQQVDDVVAYLRSLAPPPPPPPPRIPHGAPELPKDLPVIINPKGKNVSFKLREGRYVPAEEVKKALDARKRIVIIDARTTADWMQLRIPGSYPVPYHDFSRLDVVPKDDTFVVAYCACPHHASGEVVDELRRRGYQHTAVLDEGIFFWKQKGYPVDGESTTAAAMASASASGRFLPAPPPPSGPPPLPVPTLLPVPRP